MFSSSSTDDIWTAEESVAAYLVAAKGDIALPIGKVPDPNRAICVPHGQLLSLGIHSQLSHLRARLVVGATSC